MYSVRDYDQVLITSKKLVRSLQASSTADDFCRGAVDVALKSDGAVSAFVATRVEGGLIRLLGSHGFRNPVFGSNEEVSIFENRGATDAIRKNTPLFFDSSLEYGFRYPLLGGADYPGEGQIVIPVVAELRAIGCVGVSFMQRLSFEQRNSQFWDIFPLICGAFLHFGDSRLKTPSEYLRSLDF